MAKRIPFNRDEYDALTPWKRFLRWRSGQRKKIKKRYNRRERRLLKESDKDDN
jgi:hypothetical protein